MDLKNDSWEEDGGAGEATGELRVVFRAMPDALPGSKALVLLVKFRVEANMSDDISVAVDFVRLEAVSEEVVMVDEGALNAGEVSIEGAGYDWEEEAGLAECDAEKVVAVSISCATISPF